MVGNTEDYLKKLIVVMGISGAGKSTAGEAIARRLEMPFIDADDFHPRENVLKMSRGQALTDEDRWPWLASIVQYVLESHRESWVLACSALKQSYRDYLAQRLEVETVYLELKKEEAERRLQNRANHFMPSTLVQSQLDTLEIPTTGLTVDATLPIERILERTADYFMK